MKFNGNTPELDTTIEAKIMGSDCFIVTNNGHTYLLLENNWEVKKCLTGNIFIGNLLVSDRIHTHRVQVRSINPTSWGQTYKKTFVGKSWATAYDIVNFLN